MNKEKNAFPFNRIPWHLLYHELVRSEKVVARRKGCWKTTGKQSSQRLLCLMESSNLHPKQVDSSFSLKTQGWIFLIFLVDVNSITSIPPVPLNMSFLLHGPLSWSVSIADTPCPQSSPAHTHAQSLKLCLLWTFPSQTPHLHSIYFPSVSFVFSANPWFHLLDILAALPWSPQV